MKQEKIHCVNDADPNAKRKITRLQPNKVKRSDHKSIPTNERIPRLSLITGQEIEAIVLITRVKLDRAKELLEADTIQLPEIKEVAK